MTGVVKSIQQGFITLAAGVLSNTAAITAVTMANAAVLPQGYSTDNSNSTLSENEAVQLTLTSTGIVTASRSSSVSNVTIYFTVIEFRSAVVNSIQRGTIAIASASTSNTATLGTAVGGNAFVVLTGTTSPDTALAYNKILGAITLTNSNTVTASSNGTANIVVGYVVIDLTSVAIASIEQRHHVNAATTATSYTDTITSIDPNRTLVFMGGFTTANGSRFNAGHNIVLTNATTVTMTRIGVTSIASDLYYTVVQFQPDAVSGAVQRGSLANVALTASTALTLTTPVDLTGSFVNFNGITTGAAVPANASCSVDLTNGTTLTTRQVATSAGTPAVAYEVFTFASADVTQTLGALTCAATAATAQAAVINPSRLAEMWDVPSLYMWFTAGNYMSTLNRWYDSKSGFWVDMFAGATPPVYSATSWNVAYPGVTTDGTSSRMIGQNNASSIPIGPVTLGALASQDWPDSHFTVGTTIQAIHWGYGTPASGGYARLIETNNDNPGSSCHFDVHDGFADIIDVITVPLLGKHFQSGDFSTTQLGGRVDGAVTNPATIASSVGTMPTPQQIVLFSRVAAPVADRFAKGVYSDLWMLVNGTLGDKQLVEGILAWRTGMNGTLNAAHPYFASPPMVFRLDMLTVSGTATEGQAATLTQTLGALTCSATATNADAAVVNKTLGALTCSAQGTTPDNATANITLGALTSSATATTADTATLTKTLGALTLSGTAANAESVTLTATLGAATLVATATTAEAAVLNATLGAVTLIASATEALSAVLNKTLSALTTVATMTSAEVATANITLGALTLAGTATMAEAAVLSATLGPLTLSGSLTNAESAILAVTLGALTLVASGTLALSATLSRTLGALTVSAQATLAETATLTATLGALTLLSALTNAEAATLSATLGALTIIAAAKVAEAATLAQTLGSVGLNALATTADNATLTKTLGVLTVVGIATTADVATANILLGSLVLAATMTEAIMAYANILLDPLSALIIDVMEYVGTIYLRASWKDALLKGSMTMQTEQNWEFCETDDFKIVYMLTQNDLKTPLPLAGATFDWLATIDPEGPPFLTKTNADIIVSQNDGVASVVYVRIDNTDFPHGSANTYESYLRITFADGKQRVVASGQGYVKPDPFAT